MSFSNTRRARGIALLGLVASTMFGVALTHDASACGGTFRSSPTTTPSQSLALVTDHRVALAISPSMTTLWDQVEFAGDPEEFAWVLPVRGAVAVGLGSDEFMNALDRQTAPEIRASYSADCPRARGCGGPKSTGSARGTAGCASSTSDDEAALGYQEDSGVTITARSVVGPYETVQIHGEDSSAIVDWLRSHGYAIPPEIEPILSRYVNEGHNFVAVRLRPGRGVGAMRPIRVSWRGSTPVLPLRMVGAGIGAKVGVKLFVIADARWQTKTFPTFFVDPQSLTWDASLMRSNYVEMRDKMAKTFSGRAFVMESSVNVLSASIPRGLPAPLEPTRPDAARDTYSDFDATSETPPADGGTAAMDGEVGAPQDVSDAPPTQDVAVLDASTVAPFDAGRPPSIDPTATDVDIAFGSKSWRRVTRLRGELPAIYLDQDLELQEDGNDSELSPRILVTNVVNKMCPASASLSGAASSVEAAALVVAAALAAIAARRASRTGWAQSRRD